ncbi:MAG TPA: c-type cytochrome [Thermoanaerobaculia bacterium]|nr:c-type cytochrome [Thermoanaerobaculia bacterium]
MSRDEKHHPDRHPLRGPALLALTLVLPLVLVALTVSGPVYAGLAAADSGGSMDGKAIFLAEKCNTCHGVAAAGIEAKVKSEKMRGPDLDETLGEHDRGELVAFVRGEAEMDGKEHKKPFKGSDEELQVLVDWLLEQKAAE